MNRSPNVRANAIRLKRQEHEESFLVVEGRDDRLFFEQFVNRQYCLVIVADGKQNVADVVGILEADGFPGVAGVTDADLDHVEGIRPASANVIVLETVDLEALLIRSPALDRVLVELARIAHQGNIHGVELCGICKWYQQIQSHKEPPRGNTLYYRTTVI